MVKIKESCRIAVVGAQHVRVARVVSLLRDDVGATEVNIGNEEVCRVEYLPCVATFGSYENENGEVVRYLGNVEYLGLDGKQKGSSLAPFVDVSEVSGKNNGSVLTESRFPGISAFVLGCGIEAESDVGQIETFVHALNATRQESTQPVVIKCISPNPEFQTMKEETNAYKTLDATGKAEATSMGTIGPGKMARFAKEIALDVIHSVFATSPRREKLSNEEGEDQLDSSEQDPISNAAEPDATPEIDPNKTRYACRICRRVLFGEADLEDPPHIPSRHNFNRRKGGGLGGRNQCGSLFLAQGLHWMGDSSPVEGKFSCPYCGAKLGTWKWAGAQCSCGTWVTPAIQVPCSKVDILLPQSDDETPPGTVISPFVVSHPIIYSPSYAGR